MSVYVDNMKMPWRGMIMSHMTADTNDELHEMAAKLGLKRAWFQGMPAHSIEHYDVSEGKRQQAIALGAIEEDMFDDAVIRRHRYQRLRGTWPTVYNKRKKGYPAEATLVDRTTPFGNPFRRSDLFPDNYDLVFAYNHWIHEPRQAELRGLIRRTLKGRDLLCWCAPEPCHADVILRIANEEL